MDCETLLVRHEALGYGRNAAEILETGELFSQIERTWPPRDLYAFKGRAGIHDKVFQGLIAVSRDQRLKQLGNKLPANYNALFALTRYTDDELEKALSEGILGPSTSYRSINNWRKSYRMQVNREHGEAFNGLPNVEAKVSYHEDNETSREIRESLQKLQEKYPSFKLVKSFSQGRALEFPHTESISFQKVVEALKWAIDQRAGEFLNEAALLDLKNYQLSRDRPEDLKNLSLNAFRELLTKITGSSSVFWVRCGEIYQYRIGLEIAHAKSFKEIEKLLRTLLKASAK
jgi:hypothetical protein